MLQVLATFPAGLIKSYKILWVRSRASPAAVATSDTWGIHTSFRLGVLKLCQIKTLPYFLTSNPSVELEQPVSPFYLPGVYVGGYHHHSSRERRRRNEGDGGRLLLLPGQQHCPQDRGSIQVQSDRYIYDESVA